MGTSDDLDDAATREHDCSTSTSFTDHGVDRGVRLVIRTHRRLADLDDPSFEPTDAYFDRLESAFLWAYLETAEEPGVPAAVQAAIDDAVAQAKPEFADRPDADLRTDVIPWFYARVAASHCVYHDPRVTAAPGDR